eukprot:7370321-Pyramimonas_sp.AAC.1
MKSLRGGCGHPKGCYSIADRDAIETLGAPVRPEALWDFYQVLKHDSHSIRKSLPGLPQDPYRIRESPIRPIGLLPDSL